MLKLQDILETLSGVVQLYLRDGREEDLVITEPMEAKDLRNAIIKRGLRFFNYHVFEMYATSYVVFLDEEVSCLNIILVR